MRGGYITVQKKKAPKGSGTTRQWILKEGVGYNVPAGLEHMKLSRKEASIKPQWGDSS